MDHRFVPDYFGEMLNFDTENYNQTCNVVLTKNHTLIEIDRGWEGIPETLIINLVLSTILIVSFILLRNLAKTRPDSDKNSWLQFIYGDRKRTTNPIENQKHMTSLNYSDTIQDDLKALLPIHLTKCKTQSSFSSPISETSSILLINPPSTSSDQDSASKNVNFSNDLISEDQIVIQQPSNNSSTHRGSADNLVPNETTFPVNNGASRFQFFRSDSVYRFNSWLSRLFQLTEIINKKGPDAYQYLLFQQYIIVLLFILSIVCVFILLPINVQGDNEGKAFAQTTLSNLSSDSNLYWVHAVSATCTVIMGVYFMNYFSKVLKTDDDLMCRTTLLIRRIPVFKDTDIKFELQNYIQAKFPNTKITGIQFIFDYRKLEDLEQEYVNTMNSKQYCEEHNSDRDHQIQLRPYTLGRFACCCCCCCGKVDGVEYYTQEQTRLNNKINKELHQMASLTPASAFITFENEKMAMEVYKYFKEESRKLFICRSCVLNCCSTDEFNLKRSLVSYAPYPYDINWLNIGIDTKFLLLRKICLSLLLFLIFFFLSTPAFLLKILDIIANKDLVKEGIGRLGSTLTDFLSPFILMILTMLLPSIVIYACQLIPYKTISDLNHAVMSKVFAFLLMMIIILPSAGFLSINALLEDILSPSGEKRKFRWNCLFPVDNGAFFVIYVLQTAILGNTVELLRIPELCLYALYNVIIKSPAEFEKARKMITFEFPFGVSYPRFLLIFTMTIIYSHASPLIAPCGLLYMILKHFVDRYNITHVYTPSKINGRIHSTAILYVHISLIMMLFQVFTFLLTKTLYSSVTLYSLVVLLLSLLVFSVHCFYHWFRNINHLTYGVTTRLPKSKRQQKHNFCICSYTPPVFVDLLGRQASDNNTETVT